MARILMGGFAVLIALMAVLAINSVRHMQEQEDRMRDIVELRNHKIQLATDLLQATHNRHNALVYQVLVDDPFERDEHFQQYLKWGFEVGKARNALRAMPLDGYELENLRQQDELIETIVGLHETIVDLASYDLIRDAREQIAVALRPYNLQFIGNVEDLQHYERERIQESLQAASEATRREMIIEVALGLALTLLAGLIAALTYRQMGVYARTISEQMQALEQTGVQLKHEATHDPLTGLPNRSLFYHRLREAVSHARQDKLMASVLYVDLDDFKPVNDLHGHAVGDSLLQVIAGRLLQSVRATDTVARLGGDEFALILLGMGEPEQLKKICHTLHDNVNKPVRIGDITLQPGCSVGHAIFPRDGDSMDALLHAADQRMYEVKRARKGETAAPAIPSA